ncbi:MAG TPA: Gfo/Idh/MocA family oxidoreductase, partial [Limnochordales bacterium]
MTSVARPRIRAGVCGMGFIGPAHVEALRRVEGVDVVAISTREPGRGRAVAERFGVPRVYDAHEALVDDPSIDVVHICTGNRLHAPLVRRAVAAGKHVICEKPLATSLEEARDLQRLAADSRGVYAVNYQYRYYPMIQQARWMVRQGALGRLRVIHGHYIQDWLSRPTDYNWRV